MFHKRPKQRATSFTINYDRLEDAPLWFKNIIGAFKIESETFISSKLTHVSHNLTLREMNLCVLVSRVILLFQVNPF